MALTKEQEHELWHQWKKTGDDNKALQLMNSYQPLIFGTVNKFSSANVPRSVLAAEGQRLAYEAIKTYDPKRGAGLNTHIHSNLRNINRLVYENVSVGKIPEARGMKAVTFKNVKSNLTDRLGRDPSISEMADEMSWSEAEVSRMESEMAGELTAGKIEGAEFYGQAINKISRDQELMSYAYHDLTGKDKVIFEHSTGYGGKPILSNKEIAKKLRTNEMAITRSKRRMAENISSYK